MFRISSNFPVLLLLFLLGMAQSAWANEDDPAPLPSIGPWLLDSQGYPAHWLGREFQGRVLFEPVNLVVMDRYASSAEEATRKFLTEAARGGFGERYGHSAGY